MIRELSYIRGHYGLHWLILHYSRLLGLNLLQEKNRVHMAHDRGEYWRGAVRPVLDDVVQGEAGVTCRRRGDAGLAALRHDDVAAVSQSLKAMLYAMCSIVVANATSPDETGGICVSHSPSSVHASQRPSRRPLKLVDRPSRLRLS